MDGNGGWANLDLTMDDTITFPSSPPLGKEEVSLFCEAVCRIRY